MSGIVDKSLSSRAKVAVRIGNVVIHVPRDGDIRLWVTYNVPEAFWDKVTRAVEEYEREAGRERP